MVFGKFFKKRNEEISSIRLLNHARELMIGDIIKFGFTAQTGISNEDFIVSGVNTFHLDAQGLPQTVLQLNDAAGQYALAVVTVNGDEVLEVSKSILPEDVESIFDMADFIGLIESEHAQNSLSRQSPPADFDGWTAETYYQETRHEAYFHAGDFRGKSLPTEKEYCTPFDYLYLVSKDRQHALQIEIYDGGRTEVKLLVYLPLSKLEEMWPAEKLDEA